jgi:hypothetical protein
MNAIQELETNFKKQFNKVFRKLNYIISYSECVILLDTLKGVKYNPIENEYAYRWQLKFNELLA